jgi:peptide/nickel transport system permease protein
MARVIVWRLLHIIPVMIAISLIVFALLHLAPGDPAFVLAGEDATQADLQAIRVKLGLDKPLYVQYGLWAAGVARGDLGRSIITRRPVIAEIRTRVKPTAELAVAAMALAAGVGIGIGIVSAVYQYSVLDHATMVVALLGVSLPIFWVGLMLIFLFSVELRWFPTGGAAGLPALVLPTVALGAASVAIVARMTRSSVLETIRKDYTRTARAKGLAGRVIIFRHALRNALVPVVTVVGLQFGYLLGGAVVTETVFSRPGLGRMLVDAIGSRDFPVVQGGLMVLGGSFVLMNALVDLLYAYLDPRIRYD